MLLNFCILNEDEIDILFENHDSNFSLFVPQNNFEGVMKRTIITRQLTIKSINKLSVSVLLLFFNVWFSLILLSSYYPLPVSPEGTYGLSSVCPSVCHTFLDPAITL